MTATDTPRRRPPPRTLEVVRKWQLTPNMLRVTLGGEELRGFPEDSSGAYVKLHVGEPSGEDGKPLLRTYTVRRFDAGSLEMDVDFVVHESDGPAMSWAQNCGPGDTIRVGGPGPRKDVVPFADWVLFAGDMSALPAIGANLERLGPETRGLALLEIIADDDRQDLRVPPGVQVQWIVNPCPGDPNTSLFDAVRSTDWLPGRPSVWVAGEFSQSLAIRGWLRKERGVTSDRMYASSYWQIGQTEDGHRIAKRSVIDD